MKERRQAKILELIEVENVETQEELSERLRAFGIEATQATISRDIKELRLVKTLSGDGSYKYTAPENTVHREIDQRLKNIFRECVTSVKQARNLVIIKTLPGLAPAACSAVDGINAPFIMGTIAGDDTGLLITSTDEEAAAFCAELRGNVRTTESITFRLP
ncbi:arginine repressor [Oscillospiraceae bacterium OttesenSCG-928-G22]|nr:arginine repressor [Oscillospiraceae bacterium OttesenSCG-928-G22]